MAPCTAVAAHDREAKTTSVGCLDSIDWRELALI